MHISRLRPVVRVARAERKSQKPHGHGWWVDPPPIPTQPCSPRACSPTKVVCFSRTKGERMVSTSKRRSSWRGLPRSPHDHPWPSPISQQFFEAVVCSVHGTTRAVYDIKWLLGTGGQGVSLPRSHSRGARIKRYHSILRRLISVLRRVKSCSRGRKIGSPYFMEEPQNLCRKHQMELKILGSLLVDVSCKRQPEIALRTP